MKTTPEEYFKEKMCKGQDPEEYGFKMQWLSLGMIYGLMSGYHARKMKEMIKD